MIANQDALAEQAAQKKKITKICVVGLGYVGLPVAYMLAGHHDHRVTAYDINIDRVDSLARGDDPTGLVPSLVTTRRRQSIRWTHLLSPDIGEDTDVFVICVPTPLDDAGRPDHRYVTAAANEVLGVCRLDAEIVLESTVSPGTTKSLQLHAARLGKPDVTFLFSPERIDPGPGAFEQLSTASKMLACDTKDASNTQAYQAYNASFGPIILFEDTRAVELAKCFENFQRDFNIALMNDLSINCDKHGIDIEDVRIALASKEGALKFRPGLVGGHCIPVDGLFINDMMNAVTYQSGDKGLPTLSREIHQAYLEFVADHVKDTVHVFHSEVDENRPCRVLICGTNYKHDVADYRNSGGIALYNRLQAILPPDQATVAALDYYAPYYADNAGAYDIAVFPVLPPRHSGNYTDTLARYGITISDGGVVYNLTGHSLPWLHPGAARPNHNIICL